MAESSNTALTSLDNTSLATLNESMSSLSSSQGIAVTAPDFGYLSQCCNCGFGQYIFGLKKENIPPPRTHARQRQCPASLTSKTLKDIPSMSEVLVHASPDKLQIH
jgi:hypothetical protein